MGERGHIRLNGNPYRVDIGSYRGRDVTDFSPKVSTPGGGIIFSEMNMYQPINQTDWRHGFGFLWHTDASGYAGTVGNIDTRMDGVVTLFTQIQATDNSTRALNGGFCLGHDRSTELAYGDTGAYLRTGMTWIAIPPLSGAIKQIWTNGTYTFALPNNGRIMKCSDLSYYNRTATGGDVTYLEDANAEWTADQHNGQMIQIVSGAGAGQTRVVSDTTTAPNRLTPTVNFNPAPNNTSIYRIWQWSVTGVDSNATDYAWIMSHDGFTYAGKDGTNEVYFDDSIDLADLHGDPTSDTQELHVGMEGRPVIGAISYAGDLFFARWDSLYRMDKDQRNARKVLDYSDQLSASNFTSMAVFNGTLVFPIRNQLYQWNGTRVSPVSPPRLMDSYPFYNYYDFKNLFVFGNHLLLTARDSSTYNVDLLSWDGVGWSKLTTLTQGSSNSVTTCKLIMGGSEDHILLDKHIVSSATDVSGIYYFQISYYANGDLAGSPYPTTGTHSIYLSRIDAGFRRIIKSTPSVLVEGNNLGTSVRYLKLYYRLNNDTAWTPWGGVDDVSNIINTSGITELTQPTGEEYSTLEYYWIQFRVDLVTTNSLFTPTFDGITLRVLMRPDTVYGYAFNIIAATEADYGVGETDTRYGKNIMDDLRSARDSKAPIEYVDIWGTSHQVYVTSINEVALEEHVDAMGPYPNVEQLITVNLVEVG